MGRGQRLGLILSAVVFAAIAFAPAGETVTQTETQAEQPDAEEPAPAPKPPFETIRLEGGEVRGGGTITASKGDTVRIEVRSDAPDDINVHGYDISKAASRPESRHASPSTRTWRASSRSRPTTPATSSSPSW